MSEFLNDENFEKMAKEYNKKYATISVLKSNVYKKEDLEKLFSQIYLLLYMLRRVCRYAKFIATAKDFETILENTEKLLDISPKKVFKNESILVNHKKVILRLLDTLKLFHDINYLSSEDLSKIFTSFLALLTDFYAVIQ